MIDLATEWKAGDDTAEPEKQTLAKLLPETVDAAGLILDELPPDPPFIVEGVFHQGSKLVLAGSSKAGKTWSLIDLALSVASGRDWWGFKTNQCKVLYVNFEIQSEFFHRRVALIKHKRGIELAPGALQLIHLRGKRLTAELFGHAMTGRFSNAALGLVVLDPLYKLMVGKEENSTATLSSIADVIDGIASTCKAAVAYGAHFSKGNQSAKEIADRINGSGVAGRDADSILTLTKHKEEDCVSLEAVLRNCPPLEPKVMRWNFPLMEEAKELDPADLKKPGGRPEAISTVKTLEMFGRQNSMTRQGLLREAAKLKISEATMDRKLKELVKTGELTTTKGSGLYVKA